MYTESWTACSYTLLRCDVKGCQRCGIEKSSPPPPNNVHPPGAPCNWNFALQNNATNVNLRLPLVDGSDFLEECEGLLRIVDRFTSLQTLQFDFLDVCEGYVSASWDDDDASMYNLQSTIQETMGKLQDPNRSAGALREIILTGLPQNGVGLYVVRHYTRLLAPNGKIGVGWGGKGRRYELGHTYVGTLTDPECTKRDDLELLFMSVEEVGEWINREIQTMGISWGKCLIAEQEEPDSDDASPQPALSSMLYRMGLDGQNSPLTSQPSPDSEAWSDEDYGGDLEALANLHDTGSGHD